MAEDLGPFTEEDVSAVGKALWDARTSSMYREKAQAALRAIAARLSSTGRKVLRREPTPEMLAAALPIATETPARIPADVQLAERALFLLEAPGGWSPADRHQLGIDGALALIADYRALFDAAPERADGR